MARINDAKEKWMKRLNTVLAVLAATVCVLWMVTPVSALIPEPDVTYYGRAFENLTGTVSLTLDGGSGPVATFSLDPDPATADTYVLRVQMDSVGTREDGKARTGDTAVISVGSVSWNVIVAEKGSVVEFDLESAPPSSMVADPADGAALGASSYLVTGTATDGAGSGVALVEVSTDGGTSWAAATDTSVDGSWSGWSYDWAITGDGVYQLASRATDKSNNVEAPGVLVSVNADSTAPTSLMASPADGSDVGPSITFTGTATDGSGSGVTLVEVSADGGTSWATATDTSGDGSWSSWSYDWAAPGVGSYTVTSRASDAAGISETAGAGTTVYAKTLLSPSRAELDMSAKTFLPSVNSSLSVGGAPWDVDVSVATTRGWLSVDKASGQTPAGFVVTADHSGLVAGNYTGIVVFTSADAVNSPLAVPVSLMVEGGGGSSELQHYDWDEFLTGGDCNVCHQAPSMFLTDGFMQEPAFCESCHNASGVGHDKTVDDARGHSVMASVTSAGCVMPTYGNITTGEFGNSPSASLKDGDKVVCITCHNPMKKTEDYGRAWEMTTTGDGRTYLMQYGGWVGYGRLEPVVYRDKSLSGGPGNVRARKDYIVDPLEYTYDEAAGTITFAAEQDPSDYVYVTLDYPYLRASSEGNRLCSDCHAETTHVGANCLDCHQSHGSDNLAGVRGTLRAPDRAELSVVFMRYTGAGSFADSDGTHDGICEVCHTLTSYYRRDGSVVGNHSNTADYTGSDCTSCHKHSDGFVSYTTLTVATPVSVVSLLPDKTSPATFGDDITWTALAAGGNGNEYEYRFWLKDGTWSIPRDYSPDNTWTWTPTHTGTTYQVVVQVRNVGSPNAYDAQKNSGNYAVQ